MPKDNRKNKTYAKEQKEAMVAKLLPPNNMSITELSKQSGIPMTTLNGWKIRALKKINNKKNINFNKYNNKYNNQFDNQFDNYTE